MSNWQKYIRGKQEIREELKVLVFQLLRALPLTAEEMV